MISRESRYKFIDYADIPKEVRDELCDGCPSNDCGTIVNPSYHSKFKEWLEANGEDVTKCYIIWWSW